MSDPRGHFYVEDEVLGASMPSRLATAVDVSNAKEYSQTTKKRVIETANMSNVEGKLEQMFSDINKDASRTKTSDGESKSSRKKKVSSAHPKKKHSSGTTASGSGAPQKTSNSKLQPTESSVQDNHDPLNSPTNIEAKKRKTSSSISKSSSAITSEDRLLELGTPFVKVDNKQWIQVVNSSDDPLNPQQQLKAEEDTKSALVKSNDNQCTSTLSATYSSREVDPTWVCIFCHAGSHQDGLGDLFGPYFVNLRGEDLCLSSPKNSATTSTSELASKFILSPQRRRGKKNSCGHRRSSPSNPDKRTQNSEVWFHENCLCWMPQVYLVGNSQVFGLEEAILVTRQVTCVHCNSIGATIVCIQSGCRRAAHFRCARKAAWNIDEHEFSALCDEHKS